MSFFPFPQNILQLERIIKIKVVPLNASRDAISMLMDRCFLKEEIKDIKGVTRINSPYQGQRIQGGKERETVISIWRPLPSSWGGSKLNFPSASWDISCLPLPNVAPLSPQNAATEGRVDQEEGHEGSLEVGMRDW